MSAGKFAPGERWDFVEGKTLFHIEAANKGDGSPCGEAICSIPKNRRDRAKLIAAAPELLGVLKGLTDFLAKYPHQYQIDIEETLKEAEAAIQLATE